MIDSARKALAQNLKTLMKTHHATQVGIASKTKVAQTSVSNMINPEKSSPTLAQIEKVAGFFGLSAWELLIDPKAERARLTDRIFASPITIYQVERRIEQRRTAGAGKWKGKPERRQGDRRSNGEAA